MAAQALNVALCQHRGLQCCNKNDEGLFIFSSSLRWHNASSINSTSTTNKMHNEKCKWESCISYTISSQEALLHITQHWSFYYLVSHDAAQELLCPKRRQKKSDPFPCRLSMTNPLQMPFSSRRSLCHQERKTQLYLNVSQKPADLRMVKLLAIPAIANKY